MLTARGYEAFGRDNTVFVCVNKMIGDKKMLCDGREYGLFNTEIKNYEIIDDKLIVYGIFRMHEKIELIFHGYVDGDSLCVLGNHTFEYMEPTYDKDRDIWKYEIRMKGLCEFATI